MIRLAAVERGRGGPCGLRARVVDAGHQGDKLRGIPRHSVHGQGKRRIQLVLHGRTERHIVGMQLRRRGVHRDRLGSCSQHQLRVEPDGTQSDHDHVLLGKRLKSLRFDSHRILAGLERGKHKEPGIGRLAAGLNARFHVRRDHRGTRHDGSRRIRDRSLNCSTTAHLARRDRDCQERCQQAVQNSHGYPPTILV